MTNGIDTNDDRRETAGIDPAVFWAGVISLIVHALFMLSLHPIGSRSTPDASPEITVRVIATQSRSAETEEGGERATRARDAVASTGAMEDLLRFDNAPVTAPARQQSAPEGETPSSLPRPPAGAAEDSVEAASPPQTGEREFRYPRWKVSPPLYPPPFIDRGGGAYVTLRIDIAPDGTVQEVAVVETSGFPSLDYTAIEDAERRIYERSPAGRRLFRIAQFYGKDP